MEEIWKDIEGYNGVYQVSNLGRVRNIKKIHINNGIKKLSKCKLYSNTSLSKYSKDKTFLVHRLVAVHFIQNHNNLPYVCHKKEELDENGMLYNGESNLYWGTAKDNTQDMINKGRGKLIHNYWSGKLSGLHSSSKK